MILALMRTAVYIVMELVPGKDMKKLLRQRGRFTVEEGIPLIIQACAGLVMLTAPALCIATSSRITCLSHQIRASR